MARNGYRGTTLQAVAARARVSQPAVQYHFRSKEQLIEAVLDEHERLVAPLLQEVTAPGGLGSIRALAEIARHDAAHRAKAGLWNMLLAENIGDQGPLHERLVASARSYRAAVASYLEQAVERGEVPADIPVEATAAALVALLNGMETSWLLDPEVDLVGVVESHLETVIAGLREAGVPSTDPPTTGSGRA